jgi:hypothetical protein
LQHLVCRIEGTGFEIAISVVSVEATDTRKRKFAMKNRMSGITAAVALVLAFIATNAFAQQTKTQEKKIDHAEHNAMMQECAKACSDCQLACDLCATHCAHLLADGKKEHLACLMNCQDCATCCVGCAQVCARGGPLAALMIECCGKCCDECAKACEAFPNDPELKKCAAECRKCEKTCKAMAKH